LGRGEKQRAQIAEHARRFRRRLAHELDHRVERVEQEVRLELQREQVVPDLEQSGLEREESPAVARQCDARGPDLERDRRQHEHGDVQIEIIEGGGERGRRAPEPGGRGDGPLDGPERWGAPHAERELPAHAVGRASEPPSERHGERRGEEPEHTIDAGEGERATPRHAGAGADQRGVRHDEQRGGGQRAEGRPDHPRRRRSGSHGEPLIPRSARLVTPG